MTETRLPPKASRTGTPNPRVRRGTIRIPPPSPRREPRSPAAAPPPSRARGATTRGGPLPSAPQVLRGEGEEGDVSGPPEGHRQGPLVLGAGPGLPPGLDLGPLRQIPPEAVHLLVVDVGGVLGAKGTDLPPAPIPVVVGEFLLGHGAPRSCNLLLGERGQDPGDEPRRERPGASPPRRPRTSPPLEGKVLQIGLGDL